MGNLGIDDDFKTRGEFFPRHETLLNIFQHTNLARVFDEKLHGLFQISNRLLNGVTTTCNIELRTFRNIQNKEVARKIKKSAEICVICGL